MRLVCRIFSRAGSKVIHLLSPLLLRNNTCCSITWSVGEFLKIAEPGSTVFVSPLEVQDNHVVSILPLAKDTAASSYNGADIDVGLRGNLFELGSKLELLRCGRIKSQMRADVIEQYYVFGMVDEFQ